MTCERLTKLQVSIILGVIAIAAVVSLGFGIWCLISIEKPHYTRLEQEYMLAGLCVDSEIDLNCTKFNPEPPLFKCDCSLDFEVSQDLKGAVTLYYELEKFDQTNKTYASSKDDQQLLGNPGARPAESCGSYSYDANNKTIFPCGEIADSMFNDTFPTFQRVIGGEKKLVPIEYKNVLTGNTTKYRNPSKELTANFSRPKNWIGDPYGNLPWEYNTELKGVENPAFQAWMDTSLKRKPVWQVQKKGDYSDGLPAGHYKLFIKIHYGMNKYSGPRKIILEGVYTEQAPRSTVGGVILIVVAIFLLVLLVGGYIIKEKKRTGDRSKGAFRSVESSASNSETNTLAFKIKS